MEDLGSISGSGSSPGEEKGYPLRDSGLENFMVCIIHEVAELNTTERLSLHSVGTEGPFGVVRPGHEGHSPNCKPPNYNDF